MMKGMSEILAVSYECIIEIRQWKAFEKEKSDISNMAKYFNSASKNIRSTMYSDEEIYQLLGEKNSMMQQLAEKDIAIANLQEQVNSTKAKLLRLVTVEENCSTGDSAFLSASHSLYTHLTANRSSKPAETMPGDPFLPDQKLKSCRYSRLSNSQCRSKLFGEKGCSECNKQQITSPEIAVDVTEDDHDLQAFQQAPLFQKQLPGISYVSSEKLQEILQDLRMTDRIIVTQVSPRGYEQNVDRQKSTEKKPQGIQTYFSPYSSREKKNPTWLHSSTAPAAWCNLKKTASRSFSDLTGFSEAAADATEDKNPWHQLTSLSPMPHKTSGRCGWLLDKHQENCLSTLHPSSFRQMHQDLLADTVLGLYPDSDSSSSSSGRVSYCHYKQYCEVCPCNLTSSNDSSSSSSTDTDPDQGMALHYCANLYGKPHPVVNFNEDLESIYV
uniref:Uncharacterized protein n=1 Tax=Salvator merianae TaxID=96440 RepID=A0A8D0BJG2_SALMN